MVDPASGRRLIPRGCFELEGVPWRDGAPTRPCHNDRVTQPPVVPLAPRAIHADRAARTLRIDWADSHETIYDLTVLRWLCPCAYCRGEAGMPGWLDSAPTMTDEQVRLVDLHLVGNYAISPHWGDGHGTGYYSFALLRDRCPCMACTARRAGATGSTSPAPAPAAGTHEEHR